jgi:hypothetical protein
VAGGVVVVVVRRGADLGVVCGGGGAIGATGVVLGGGGQAGGLVVGVGRARRVLQLRRVQLIVDLIRNRDLQALKHQGKNSPLTYSS